MSIALVEGSPDDFWSEKEEMALEADVARRITLAQIIGRGPIHEAVFNVNHDVNALPAFGRDPYNKFPYLNLN